MILLVPLKYEWNFSSKYLIILTSFFPLKHFEKKLWKKKGEEKEGGDAIPSLSSHIDL